MATERMRVEVDAIIRSFQRKMKQVEMTAKKAVRRAEKPIDADTSKALSKIARLVAVTKAALKREKKIIDADVSRYLRKMGTLLAVNKAMERSNKGLWNALSQDVDVFQQRLNRLATNIRSIGTVLTNVFSGTLISNLSMLAPIIATLTGVVATLGNALGVVAASAFALVTAVGFAGAAFVAFAAVAVPAISGVFEEGAKLTKQQKKAKKAFDDFTKTYKKMAKALENPVLEIFTKAMNTATRALKMAEPLFESATKAVDRLMDSLSKSLGTPPVQKFFDTMNKEAGPLFETVMQAVGYALQGLMSLMVAFAPLAKSTARGFRDMMKRFSEWAYGLQSSKAFQNFVDYVNTNMPKVRRIFGNAILGIIDLFAAFSGQSADFLTATDKAMKKFRDFARSLDENKQFQQFLDYIKENAPKVMGLIGNLTKFIVNLGIGLAPLGSILLDLMNGFLSWANSLMESHRWVGVLASAATLLVGGFMILAPIVIFIQTVFGGLIQTVINLATRGFQFLLKHVTKLLNPVGLLRTGIGLLGKVFVALSTPVLFVIGIVTLLISVFVRMWNENENLRNGVMTVWETIKNTISEVVSTVSEFVMEIWGQMVTWWNENNEQILETAQRVWDFVYWVISEAIYKAWDTIVSVYELLQPYIAAVWENIKTIIEAAWNIIKSVVQNGMDIIFGIIELTMALINGDWSAAWDAIKKIVGNVLEIIWDIVKTVFTAVWDIIKQTAIGMWNTIKEYWDKFWQKISEVASKIRDWVIEKFEEQKQRLDMILPMIKAIITQKWEEAKQAMKEKLQQMVANLIAKFFEMRDNAKAKAAELVSNVIQKFIELKDEAIAKLKEMVTNAIDKFIEFKDEAIKKANEAKDNVVRIVSEFPGKVREFIGDMVSAGGDLINGLIDGAVGMASDAINTVSEIAGDMVDAALKFFKIKSPSRVFRKIGMFVSEGLAVGVAKNAALAVSEVSDMARGMTDAFSPDLAIADMRASAVLDTSISSGDMRGIKQGISAEVSDFEMPEAQIVVHNEFIGGELVTYVNQQNARNTRKNRW